MEIERTRSHIIAHGAIEEAPCPVCQCVDRETAYEGFEPYSVVRCRSCGLYYLCPRPTEDALLELYGDDAYFEGEGSGYTSYEQQEGALRATFARFLANLAAHRLTGGALLEVGCGYGYLLEEARSFYRTRAGTDFSSRAVQRAGRIADCVYRGGLDRVPAEERFDCILAAHVIEHLYDPRGFLEQAIQHLTPGGGVVIATPDMGSLWRRIMGRRWPSFKIPEHVVFFDQRSLMNLLREVGLEDVTPISYPHAFPLSLVAAKLGVRLPMSIGKIVVWLPATTVAAYGRCRRA